MVAACYLAVSRGAAGLTLSNALRLQKRRTEVSVVFILTSPKTCVTMSVKY
jgi:hypothetical protein